MLNDKHIRQWAGYLIEEFLNWEKLEEILRNHPEIDEVFIDMYKKGYEDCIYDHDLKYPEELSVGRILKS